ncbi:hypothetical protein N7462_006401 [Penicillium macrosclerotiorum]|uniref:uncharacterized protein n=1 Tax=Penicillium macrosclerotiorum TaxID=303699 RepID=UPI0025477391|nr:uncharacterized protein N7462_006401 [Penicillium macrosclerotiorum]KAJ5683236.1 hypothetical protein N7462_006401 [Penicillium macrosclerotiorum]
MSDRFTPKVPVQLDPPKDDPISNEELAKCDGSDPSRPTLVAIKGIVFDVTRNAAYGSSGQYRGKPREICNQSAIPGTRGRQFCAGNGSDLTIHLVFAGKDSSRALACSSLKPEDCVPEWSDLEDKEKTVLDEWFTFFSKRYNIVGKVEGATNT